MSIFILIGALVGIVMGLTGAGGALISIPLFISLIHTSLKDATSLSLTVVFIGASLSLATSLNRPDVKTSVALLLFSSIGSYLSLPLKRGIPEAGIAVALILIAAYSVYAVWSKKKTSTTSEEGRFLWGRTVIAGIGLGSLTTLTGLGGGVLLVPIFKKFFYKDYSSALSTSLLSIALVSLSSLVLQSETVFRTVDFNGAFGLFAGVLLGALSLRWISKKIEPKKLDIIRKVSFALVAAYSIGSFALNAIN